MMEISLWLDSFMPLVKRLFRTLKSKLQKKRGRMDGVGRAGRREGQEGGAGKDGRAGGREESAGDVETLVRDLGHCETHQN